MTSPPTIHGHCSPRFGAVADAFTEGFTKRGELGASVSVWHLGSEVVKLWAGIADPASGRPWAEDTIGVAFSSTKGMTALCLMMLADRGELDYDAPITTYWPSFAEPGSTKADITVRCFLNHRSGLCAIEQPLGLADFEDRKRLLPALEAQQPLWEPGTTQGYHAVSFGPFMAELFWRIAGESIGSFFAREVAGPLGVDFHIGLSEEDEGRVATVVTASMTQRLFKVVPTLIRGAGWDGRLFRAAITAGSYTKLALTNPAELGVRHLDNFNTPRVHRMELPWAGGIGTASALARVYATLAAGGTLDGVQLVRPETVAAVHPRLSWQQDEVLHKTMGFSLGFVKEEPDIFSPNPDAFGHPGAGGVLGLADPTENLAIGYVMNRMDWRLRSPRAMELCKAVYSCV
jgi:CubicO group peptidase (beta-lactamase class C family)